ncbi:MBL fold metallo-hydrolase [Spirulina major]|uniref:MBL fold metallo-hydrolase n=1 Tax=Spirulina major TaxID=270636 RepID=UPI001C31BE57|nr:MBL fold metallo-hydrolase [Spirulina major]
MLYLTYLDVNSWLIEWGGLRILVDPWFVGPLVFGNAPWFFKTERRSPRSIPDNIDLILLSQGIEDHAHPPTLAQCDRAIPVIASPTAAKVVEKLGYETITALQPGKTWEGDTLQIQAVPGASLGPTVTENGYVITNSSTQQRLYYEPHGMHSQTVQASGSIDVVITPLIDLALPLLGPVIQGASTALPLVKAIAPQFILPTAAGGDVVATGILTNLIQSNGTIASFQSTLQAQDLTTQVMEPIPGDRTPIPLTSKVVSP